MRAHNPAYRWYLKRMAVAIALYLVTMFVAAKTLHHAAPLNALAIFLSLLPGIAVVLMLFAIGRLLIELEDEYLRLIEVRKSLIATGFTLAVTSVWGLLEAFTVVPKLDVFWVFPIWSLGLAVGAIFNRVTMGTAGLL